MSKNILLVEDQGVIALKEAKTIENQGFKVITAFTGEDAVRIVKTDNDISLVLMDIDLGNGIDGTEAAEQILADRDLPIIFLTSHSEKEYVDKVKKITRYGYVLKNSGDFVLIESIHMAFELFEAKMEAKRKEESLRKSENRLDLAMSVATDGIWDYDLVHDDIYFDARYYKMAGYTPGEFPSKPEEFRKRVHPDDIERILEKAKEYLEGKIDEFLVELRFKRRDNSYMWIKSEGKIVERNDQGRPTRFIGTNTDVTKRKEAERELHESRALFYSLIESLPQNIFSKDLDGRFTFANQRYYARENKGPKNIIGKTDFDLHPPELAAQYRADDRNVIEQKQIIERDEIHQPLDGDKTHVHVLKAPVYNAEGDVKGVLGMFWDITECKGMEEGNGNESGG